MGSQITNSDIMREIKAISKVTDDHESRLKVAEHYITTQEAVANYVSRYGTSDQKDNRATQNDKTNILASTIVKLFVLFTAVIGLITLVIQTSTK